MDDPRDLHTMVDAHHDTVALIDVCDWDGGPNKQRVGAFNQKKGTQTKNSGIPSGNQAWQWKIHENPL